ncbi:response regulator [Geomesophilobacter sediminis]|uniref:Response regulator n=1 Tax=Geomesophilobacter sediminis TaxID=2798584 RepID=A0A8J7M1A9_9BACT|nr:response regulator [Geomesophilobacter sediminis]MBJ6726840.1 response regulator [Geomesophilobacter sediminis]
MAKRILIAEDDEVTRDLLQHFARKRKFEVAAVGSGLELLEAATNERFDLVITDLVMPEVNGASAMEIMKLRGAQTPFVALTGVTENELELVRDKFSKIFFKPVDMMELFNYIETVI